MEFLDTSLSVMSKDPRHQNNGGSTTVQAVLSVVQGRGPQAIGSLFRLYNRSWAGTGTGKHSPAMRVTSVLLMCTSCICRAQVDEKADAQANIAVYSEGNTALLGRLFPTLRRFFKRSR